MRPLILALLVAGCSAADLDTYTARRDAALVALAEAISAGDDLALAHWCAALPITRRFAVDRGYVEAELAADLNEMCEEKLP